MVLARLNHRLATLIRLVALVLISWSVLNSHHHPGGSGRGLVVTISFVVCVVAWLVWTIWPTTEPKVTPDLYALAVGGGVLAGASPGSAASAFVFVAVGACGVRVDLARVFVVVALSVVIQGGSLPWVVRKLGIDRP